MADRVESEATRLLRLERCRILDQINGHDGDALVDATTAVLRAQLDRVDQQLFEQAHRDGMTRPLKLHDHEHDLRLSEQLALSEARAADDTGLLPFSDLRTHGLLWLINACVFHPRGFALAVSIDQATGEPKGWRLLGDGAEPWRFGDDVDRDFMAAEAFFEAHRSPLGGVIDGER